MLPLQEAATRLIDNLFERPDAPMAFRFALQPAMAAFIAIKDGIRDGKSGAPPYFLTIILPSEHRRAAVIEGLRATARVLILAVVLDVIYQIVFNHVFYPGETVIVAVILAILPYTLLRGPVSRFVKWSRARVLAKAGGGGKP